MIILILVIAALCCWVGVTLGTLAFESAVNPGTKPTLFSVIRSQLNWFRSKFKRKPHCSIDPWAKHVHKLTCKVRPAVMFIGSERLEGSNKVVERYLSTRTGNIITRTIELESPASLYEAPRP